MELLSIFTRIVDWLTDQTNAVLISLAITFVGGFLTKKGWTLIIDKIAKKGAIISKKVEEKLIESADVAGALTRFFGKVDDSIKEDGTIVQNSVKEAIEAGREVYIEGKDVFINVTPKKKLPPIKETKIKQTSSFLKSKRH